MALIVEYHVVADIYPCAVAVTAGMQVNLNAAGQVVPTPVGAGINTVLGIAGDSHLAAEGETTAYSDRVIIGAHAYNEAANQRWTSNRVSDFYDETAASGKITVYHGGGKFWISEDLFDGDGAAFAVNDLVGRSAAVAGEWARAATAGQHIGLAVGALQNYPSGVPGTDIQQSITLGQFIPIKLIV